jgi:hypothetical protein
MSRMRLPLAVAIFASAAAVATAGFVVSPKLGVVPGKATATSSTLTLYPWSGDEFPVRIPVQPGWAPSLLPPSDDAYPSDRAIVANTGIRDNGYAPTLILSVDRLDPGQTPAGYAAELSDRVGKVSKQLSGNAGEVCGRPAYLMDFTGMSSGGADLKTQSGMGIVVVPDEGPHAYIAVLQTRDLGSAGYLAQRDALLSGYCIGD